MQPVYKLHLHDISAAKIDNHLFISPEYNEVVDKLKSLHKDIDLTVKQTPPAITAGYICYMIIKENADCIGRIDSKIINRVYVKKD